MKSPSRYDIIEIFNFYLLIKVDLVVWIKGLEIRIGSLIIESDSEGKMGFTSINHHNAYMSVDRTYLQTSYLLRGLGLKLTFS